MRYDYSKLAKEFSSTGVLTIWMGKRKGFASNRFVDFNEPPKKLMETKSVVKLEKTDIGDRTAFFLYYAKHATMKSKIAKESKDGKVAIIQLNEGIFIKKVYYDYFMKHYSKVKFYTAKQCHMNVAVRTGDILQGFVVPYMVGREK